MTQLQLQDVNKSNYLISCQSTSSPDGYIVQRQKLTHTFMNVLELNKISGFTIYLMFDTKQIFKLQIYFIISLTQKKIGYKNNYST